MTVFLIFWRVDLKIIVREEGISPKTSQWTATVLTFGKLSRH